MKLLADCTAWDLALLLFVVLTVQDLFYEFAIAPWSRDREP